MEPERYELREAPRYHFTPDRRDFIKTLGGGVVVCLVARNAGAQQRSRGRGGGGGKTAPQQIGGWLHIADGPLAGIAATGKRVRMQELAFWQVVEGKLRAIWSQGDSLGLRIQLGAIPASAWDQPVNQTEASS
jgi:hypothetical protein